MAVMSESSSSFFSFSFFTRLSMARLAKPSFSPPCRWHIRLWTMLRQASLLLGGFTDMMLYDATGHKSKACYLWTHNVHSDQLILALNRYSDIEILIGKQTFLDVNLIRWGKYGGKDFLGKLGKFPEHAFVRPRTSGCPRHLRHRQLCKEGRTVSPYTFIHHKTKLSTLPYDGNLGWLNFPNLDHY